MIENGLPQVDKHKVVVLTITYNHSKYIEDTLKGFAMQQTDFPFLCCVFDDASTDGEQEVLKKWIDDNCNPDDIEVYDHPLTTILKSPDKMNPNCVYVVHLQKVNTWGKPEKKRLINYWSKFGEYIAFCEGDDYWTDPYKLQKQVDYMESHLNCSLLHTSFMFYDQDNHTLKDSIIDNEIYREAFLKKKNIACEIIDFKYRVVTATSLFKSKIYDQLLNDPEYTKHKFLLGDIQLWTMLLQYGDIGYIPDNTAVYRVNSNSVCRSTNIKTGARFSLSVAEMQMYFIPKVNGVEYLQEKFKNNFKKGLFKYRLFDPQYKSFIKLEESELPLLYRVILSNVFTRSMVLFVWWLKRKVLRNSPTKVSSMK